MTLALKLFMTPLLIATATLAGRRWGPGISGWLIGFPLTSGPVSLILAIQYGRGFAAQAAIGTLGGQASVCIFCLVYSLAALKMSWPACALVAIGGFLLSVLIWNHFTLFLLPTFITLLLVIFTVLQLIPRGAVSSSTPDLPAWDLPVRMIVATLFVLLLTGFAAVLGPQLSGLISPFPVFGLVLAVFAHQQQGAGAAMRLVRGNVSGSFAFAFFFLIVALLLPGSLSLVWVYCLAALAAVAGNVFSLRLAR
jgi:hypothetical protein